MEFNKGWDYSERELPEQPIARNFPYKEDKFSKLCFNLIDNVVKSSDFIFYLLGPLLTMSSYKKGMKKACLLYEKALEAKEHHKYKDGEILKKDIILPISDTNYSRINRLKKDEHPRILNKLAGKMIGQIEAESSAKFAAHQIQHVCKYGYSTGKPPTDLANSFYMMYYPKMFIVNTAIWTSGKKIINVKGNLIYMRLGDTQFRIYFCPKQAVEDGKR